ncbi:MAG: hypothetical protein RLO80_06835 [Hyphomonas sp.]
MPTPPDAPLPPSEPATLPPPEIIVAAEVAQDAEKAERKPFIVRTFSLSLGQALRLVFLSTLVGFFVLAFDFAPTGATFDLGGAFTAIVHAMLTAVGWIFENFWKPALAGSVIVLPIWGLWRLIRSAFRKG